MMTDRESALQKKLADTEKRLNLKKKQLNKAKQAVRFAKQKEIGVLRQSTAFADLLATGKFSDVVLQVEEQKFKAHRLILSFQSPVFEAMFGGNEMMESKEGVVKIEDIDKGVLAQLLGYLYTGKVNNFKQYASRLYQASEKYQVSQLKAKCERYLWNNVRVDNVCEILQLADLHNSDQLKKRCLQFIRKNARKVKETAGWKAISVDMALQLGLNLN